MKDGMETPGTIYEARLRAGELRPDPAQGEAVARLDALHAALSDIEGPVRAGLLTGFFSKRKAAPAGPKGLYMWGGVGRGKSMLMDLFFEAAPLEPKRRVHFHAFMAEVQDRLTEARATQTRDPIGVVATEIAQSARLLCFDELQITDIADAMIVGRLFEKLFEAGVVVVTTSNRHPSDLYKDGLNRKLFLPFIDLIQERLSVFEMASGDDHRRAALAGRPLYFSPIGDAASAGIETLWGELAGGQGAPLVLLNKGREVVVPLFQNGVARGNFEAFCAQAYGPSDFLLIAEAASVVIIEEVPVLSRRRNNEAKRFVTFIDALYEARTRLIISAEAEPEQLYEEGPGAFEFQRTVSRLLEMRGADWGKDAEG